MILSRNRLYLYLGIACLVGYIWVCINTFSAIGNSNFSVCVVKNVTGLPCPSCGSTRAVGALFHGDILQAFYFNPFGLILGMGMVIFPFWIAYDLLAKKNTLLWFYEKLEELLPQAKVAVPLIVLVVLNWIWNIYKGI